MKTESSNDRRTTGASEIAARGAGNDIGGHVVHRAEGAIDSAGQHAAGTPTTNAEGRSHAGGSALVYSKWQDMPRPIGSLVFEAMCFARCCLWAKDALAHGQREAARQYGAMARDWWAGIQERVNRVAAGSGVVA